MILSKSSMKHIQLFLYVAQKNPNKTISGCISAVVLPYKKFHPIYCQFA